MNFPDLRYGLFIHYGLFSLLGRGEWARNREQIPSSDYTALQHQFTAGLFDADALCDLAVRGGMRYLVFTTMHHDGFRLYPTDLTPFNSVVAPARRDLVGEVVAAARHRGLKIGLYHSLNNWHDKPDACDALESPQHHRRFIEQTMARVDELVRRFNPIDILWYDGWWPFDSTGWHAEEMNHRVRRVQPHILFNGRNGLLGDFATPEGHLTSPKPWRPWEACMTLNDSWGYHAGDHRWKSPADVVSLLASCANGRGNLLLNVGPCGDGSVPEPSVQIIRAVGDWLTRAGGEAIFDTDPFTTDPREQSVGAHSAGGHRGDWHHHGPITARGSNLYLLLTRWPGPQFSLGGIGARVLAADLLGESPQPVRFCQTHSRVSFDELPVGPPDPVCPVLRLRLDGPPSIYLTGGMRAPKAPHPRYDPCPSDTEH